MWWAESHNENEMTYFVVLSPEVYAGLLDSACTIIQIYIHEQNITSAENEKSHQPQPYNWITQVKRSLWAYYIYMTYIFKTVYIRIKEFTCNSEQC